MQRRYFISLAGLAWLPRALAAGRARTPAQAEGPYYPPGPIPLRSDLVLDAKLMRGQRMHLSGRVLDSDGQPRPNVRIEIWQCDSAGIYAHPRQRNAAQFDQYFAGSGAQVTDRRGGYYFRTLYPVPYTRRPPHIHVKLWQGARAILTSQLYLHGQTGNEWFGSEREHLQMLPTPDAHGELAAQFDFTV